MSLIYIAHLCIYIKRLFKSVLFSDHILIHIEDSKYQRTNIGTGQLPIQHTVSAGLILMTSGKHPSNTF